MTNAEADEIFFDINCSSALNVISSGLEFPPGSNVVSTDLAFPSTPLTWLNQSRRALEVRLALAENGMVTLERLAELVDEKTIAVSVCYVEYSSGFRHNSYAKS